MWYQISHHWVVNDHEVRGSVRGRPGTVWVLVVKGRHALKEALGWGRWCGRYWGKTGPVVGEWGWKVKWTVNETAGEKAGSAAGGRLVLWREWKDILSVGDICEWLLRQPYAYTYRTLYPNCTETSVTKVISSGKIKDNLYKLFIYNIKTNYISIFWKGGEIRKTNKTENKG